MGKRLGGRIVIWLVCGLIASASAVYAQPQVQEKGTKKAAGYWHERQGGKEGPFKELNLTAEQKEKLKGHKEAQKESSRALREQIKAKMQALHAEIGKPTVDRAQINALVAEINNLKGQLFAQHTEGILAMKEILTPEQFAKMQKGFEKHHGKQGRHMPRQKGSGEGPGEGPRGGPGEGPEEGPNE